MFLTHRQGEIELMLAGEEVGDAIPPQAGEVAIRDLFAQHDDDPL
jgi:hypothetical protein